jgi:hypothetical protein
MEKGSAPIVLSLGSKVYLTAWYYPVAAMTTQDISFEPPDAPSSKKNRNGMGTYPDPAQNNPASRQPFPSRDTGTDPSPLPPSPTSTISKHRALMKNVESTRNSEGAVTLTSKSSSIKIDKLTVYVLATGDLLPTN